MYTICFSNLKGGVGKSSITLEAANYFSKKDKNVIIVDCDIAQKTLYNAYELSEDPVYDVIRFDPSVPLDKWEQLLSDLEAYDYAFFDIPGTVHQEGIISLISIIDSLIVLTRHSAKDMASTATYIDLLKENNITNFKVMFNMLRPYRDTDHKELIEEIKSGKSGVNSSLLGIDPSAFFQNNIWEEQAAIEKNMEIGSTHKKIFERYDALFEELEKFINQERK